MAIRVITGVPGAGKSYYAVKHIRDNYFQFDKKKEFWFPKPGVLLISNIDELKLSHTNLDVAIRDSKQSLEDFFSVPYQQKIIKKYKNVVYFIDEAQRYFPDNFRNREVFYLFQYHRHLGIDFFLMTQSIWLIPKSIRELIEFEVRAVKRSLSVFGELKYNIKSDNEIVDRKLLKKDSKIFNLYKSMDLGESEKLKNPIIKYLIAIVLIMVLSVYLFKNTFFGGVADADQSKKVNRNLNDSKKIEKVIVTSETPKEIKDSYFENYGLDRVKLSYVISLGELYVVNPITRELQHYQDVPFKLTKTYRNDKLTLYGLFDPSLVKKDDPSQDKKRSSNEIN